MRLNVFVPVSPARSLNVRHPGFKTPALELPDGGAKDALNPTHAPVSLLGAFHRAVAERLRCAIHFRSTEVQKTDQHCFVA